MGHRKRTASNVKYVVNLSAEARNLATAPA